MEENRNDIEILKAMIKDNFEEQRKLIAKLETALEAVTSFNGKRCQQAAQVRFTADVRASLERLFPGREPCGLCDEWRTLSHLVYGGVEKAV